MKKSIALLALSLMILSPLQSSFGQDTSVAATKFGLGLSLYNVTSFNHDYYANQFNPIYMTLDINKKLRLDAVGGFNLSDLVKNYYFGIGVFGKKPLPKFDLLYGARLELDSHKTKAIAPTIGGEYYLMPHFSIGGEVQLKGLYNDKSWSFLTNTSFITRFYF